MRICTPPEPLGRVFLILGTVFLSTYVAGGASSGLSMGLAFVAAGVAWRRRDWKGQQR